MTVAAIADPDHCPDLTFITDTLNGQLRHLARQGNLNRCVPTIEPRPGRTALVLAATSRLSCLIQQGQTVARRTHE